MHSEEGNTTVSIFNSGKVTIQGNSRPIENNFAKIREMAREKYTSINTDTSTTTTVDPPPLNNATKDHTIEPNLLTKLAEQFHSLEYRQVQMEQQLLEYRQEQSPSATKEQEESELKVKVKKLQDSELKLRQQLDQLRELMEKEIRQLKETMEKKLETLRESKEKEIAELRESMRRDTEQLREITERETGKLRREIERCEGEAGFQTSEQQEVLERTDNSQETVHEEV